MRSLQGVLKETKCTDCSPIFFPKPWRESICRPIFLHPLAFNLLLCTTHIAPSIFRPTQWPAQVALLPVATRSRPTLAINRPMRANRGRTRRCTPRGSHGTRWISAEAPRRPVLQCSPRPFFLATRSCPGFICHPPSGTSGSSCAIAAPHGLTSTTSSSVPAAIGEESSSVRRHPIGQRARCLDDVAFLDRPVSVVGLKLPTQHPQLLTQGMGPARIGQPRCHGTFGEARAVPASRPAISAGPVSYQG